MKFIFAVSPAQTQEEGKQLEEHIHSNEWGGNHIFFAPHALRFAERRAFLLERPLPRIHRPFSPISFEANIFNRTIARLLKKGKVRGTAGDCPVCCGRAAYEFSRDLVPALAARGEIISGYKHGRLAHARPHHEAVFSRATDLLS
jgi:hypothetical protein